MKLISYLLFIFLIEMHHSKRLLRLPLRGRDRKIPKSRSNFANLLSVNVPLDIGFGVIEIGLKSDGQSQKFAVQFDTATNGIWVFSKLYDTCDPNYYTVNDKQQLYDRTTSITYKAVKDTRPKLFLRTKGWVFGFKAYDMFTILETRINATFIEVTKSAKYTADGKYGSSIGLQYDPKTTNLIAMICTETKRINPEFAVFYPRIRAVNSDFNDGQLIFCGDGKDKYVESTMVYVKIDGNDHGSWRIPVNSIRLEDSRGGTEISSFASVLIDTVTTQIYIPEENFKIFYELMKPFNPEYPTTTEFDCKVLPRLPKFILRVGGEDFTLMPDDYMYKAQNGAAFTCVILVNQSPSGNWSVGEPILRRYYTLFDALNHRIGFAERT